VPTSGSLTVFVTIASTGAAQPGATVIVTLDGGMPTTHTTDAQGKVTFTAFGSYEFNVSFDVYNAVTASATLSAADATQTVRVALSKDTTVGGDKPANLTIKCVDKNGTDIYSLALTSVVGRTETITAPPIEGYKLAEGELSSKTLKIVTGDNIVTFRYVADDGGEDDMPSRPPASDKIKDVLETHEHIKYIQGYSDGTVNPNGSITRAEVATIFWRLIKSEDKNNAIVGTFSDVEDGKWYSQAVNYLVSIGIIKGYEDGTFKPSQSITRAEFATIASRFDDLDLEIINPFIDVPSSHWAHTYVVSAYSKGWISGYPGDIFLPDNNITRAEVVKIVNCMLGRGIEKKDVPSEFNTLYNDLTTGHWAFAEIIEASVEHDYERKENGYEIHT